MRLSSDFGNKFYKNATFNTTNGQIQVVYDDTSEFRGNISINNSKVNFNKGNGVLNLSGVSSQVLSGSADFEISKLIINKSAEEVTIQRKLLIDTLLNLHQGFIICDDTNSVTLKSAAQVTEASDSSFVDGKVRKIGNTTFVFPVGNNESFYPISISAPSNVTDIFSIIYYKSSQALGDSLDTNLVYLSECRYWNLQRENGTSKVKLEMDWINDSMECEQIIPYNIKLVRWDSSIWENTDSLMFEGNYEEGTLATNDSISEFGYFTLGGISTTYEKSFCDPTPDTSTSVLACVGVNSSLYVSKYGTLPWNVPIATQVIKTINVNVHIFYDPTDLSKNFDPNNATDVNHLNVILSNVNGIYSSINNFNQSPPNLPFTPPVLDTRIQFDFNVVWHNNHAYENSSVVLESYVFGLLPQYANQLNIYAVVGVGSHPGWGMVNMFPSYTNLNASSNIISWDVYRNGLVTGFYSISQHWAHEIGHNLGLGHTYNPTNETCNQSDPEYLWDIFGFGTGSLCLFPNTSTSNDLMGGHSEYTSPLQMARMHRALSFSNMRKYVDRCESLDNSEIVVSSNETWDFDFKCYQNIRVETGSTLTLTCNLLMKGNSKIVVEDGARLIVDGARIYTDCDMWHGIELWGNKSQGQGILASTTQGVVEFKNGAIVENAYNVVTTIKYDITTNSWDWNKTGGIIIAENSTFKNNCRVFQFLYYKNFRIGFPNQSRNNLSSIKNCVLETDYNLQDYTKRPFAFISMYEVHGVTIKGNTFRNTNPSSVFDLREHGSGIISADSRFSLSSLGSDINEFENLWYGVYSSNSNTPNPLTIKDAVFTGCNTSIFASNINYLSLNGNVFNVPERGVWPNATDPSYGVLLDACPSYLIEDNDFESISLGDADYGISVRNSGNQLNYIYNNIFNGFKNTAILAIDDNDGPAINDGLIINCNDFDNQIIDEISVDKSVSSLSHGIGQNQGACGNTFVASRNRFYSNVCGGSGLELKVKTSPPPTSIIDYASSNLSANAILTCYTSGSWVNNTSCSLNFNKGSDCPPFIGNSTSQLRSIISSYDEEIVEYESALNSGLSNDLEYTIRAMELDSSTLADIINESPYVSQNLLIAILDHVNEYAETGYFDQIEKLFIQNCKLTSGVYNYLVYCSTNSDYAALILDTVSYHMTDDNPASDVLIGLDNAINMRDFYVSQYINSCSNSEDTLYQAYFADTCISLLNKYSSYLLKHDSYLLNGDYTNAQLMLDSLDTLGLDEGFYSFIHTLDTINERSGSYLFGANQIMDGLYSQKDNFTKTGAISRGILTLLNDSIFEAPVFEGGSEERIRNPFTLVEGETYTAYLFPNPTSNLLNVNVISKNEISINLIIFDLKGKSVLNKALQNAINSVDVSKLNPGLYIVSLCDENGIVKNEKFIKL